MAVPVPGIGKKSYLQSVREATWGTDLACTQKHRIKSADNKSKPTLVMPGALQNTIAGPASILTRHEALLDVGLELTYSGMLRFIDLCMGTDTYAATGGVTTGAGPYTHTFKQRPVLNSHTMELGAADITASKVEQFNGMKVSSFEISGGEGKPLIELSMSLMGKLLTTNVSPTGALSDATVDNIRFADMTEFDDGSGDTDKGIPKSFSLKVDNKIAFREQGTLYTAEPIREDYSEVSLDVESEFSSRNLLDKYMASTEATNMTLYFSPSASLGFRILMPAGHLEPWGRPIETRGIVRQRFTWKAHEAASSTASGLSLSFLNAVSTI